MHANFVKDPKWVWYARAFVVFWLQKKLLVSNYVFLVCIIMHLCPGYQGPVVQSLIKLILD